MHATFMRAILPQFTGSKALSAVLSKKLYKAGFHILWLNRFLCLGKNAPLQLRIGA